MYHWNTSTIEAHLNQISGVVDVEVNRPGGDVDTDNITLTIAGASEKLYIAGFEVSDRELPDKSDIDVEFVELTDGTCSTGGLNCDDFRVAEAFIHVRQYFVVNGATVVNNMDHFF